MTVTAGLIQRELGMLSAALQQRVAEKLRKPFQL